MARGLPSEPVLNCSARVHQTASHIDTSDSSEVPPRYFDQPSAMVVISTFSFVLIADKPDGCHCGVPN